MINEPPFTPGMPEQVPPPITPVPPPYTGEVPPMAPPPEPRRSRLVLIVVAVILLVLIAGSAFAYIAKVGPFSSESPLYSEETFLAELLIKSSKIESAAYSGSLALKAGQRDAGARPFEVEVSNLAEVKEQYENDSTRADDVKAVMNLLKYSKKIPSSLKQFADEQNKTRAGYGKIYITDPATKKEYGYSVTGNGSDFKLIVTFESDKAVSEIRKAAGAATSTIINGKTVTFTKNSPMYFYLTKTPPKPFVVQVGDMMNFLPADMDVSATVSAKTDFSKKDLSDWIFNFDATGSFGDLSYKANADVLKKGENYYFKVNNIPSILLGSLSTLKGKWLKVPMGSSTNSTNSVSKSTSRDYSKDLSDIEKEYKKQREAMISLLQKAATLAKEEKLIVFKSTPRTEKVEGRELTRYEISMRKEAILPFYTKLAAAVNEEIPDLREAKKLLDQGLIDYLKSKEFSDVFDYYDQYTSFVFWADAEGYPAILEETIRVIPPDSATLLKDKQLNIILKLVFSEINKPVKITAPANAELFSKIMEEVENSMLGGPRAKAAEATLKANISNVRASAEIVYDSNGSSYGKKPFSLGPCKQTASTLFGDANIYKQIDAATLSNASKATCISKGIAGNVTSYAVSVPLPDSPGYSWCIDSMGSSNQIKGIIKDSICELRN